MGIKERIKNHPVIWILATLLAGFTAGLAVYQAILEIAHLEVVPKGAGATIQSVTASGVLADSKNKAHVARFE